MHKGAGVNVILAEGNWDSKPHFFDSLLFPFHKIWPFYIKKKNQQQKQSMKNISFYHLSNHRIYPNTFAQIFLPTAYNAK